MTNKRFRVRFEQEDGRGEIVNEKGVELTAREVVDLLNNLHQENQELKEKLKEKEEDEQLYAKEIVKLNEMLRFKTLGGDY